MVAAGVEEVAVSFDICATLFTIAYELAETRRTNELPAKSRLCTVEWHSTRPLFAVLAS